ncbi:SDR family oxidoreductase [Arachnia propionica]|uniref:SDR family oxidoreductase n=1 Tax=Arachnia propionica TaxID=1750 RepID=UPI0037BE9978
MTNPQPQEQHHAYSHHRSHRHGRTAPPSCPRRPDRAHELLGNRATVRTGDLAAPQTLGDAFTDIDSLFLFCVPETASEVVRQARETGVQHIVVLSAAAVTLGFDYGHHSTVEAAVKDSGLAWTMVRPGEFMANMLPIWGLRCRFLRPSAGR